MMKTSYFLALHLMIGFGTHIHAQVRIGSTNDPHEGSVLDLNANDTDDGVLGLTLPRVALTNTEDWQLAGSDHIIGMIIYNTNPAVGEGIYTWQGDAIGWASIPTHENTVAKFKNFDLNFTTIDLLAGGTAKAVSAINFIDTNNNPLSGLTVTWTWPTAQANSCATVTSSGNNIYVAPKGSNNTGSFTLTATYGNVSKTCTVKVDNCSKTLVRNGAFENAPARYNISTSVFKYNAIASLSGGSTGDLCWMDVSTKQNISWNDGQINCISGWRLPNVWEAAYAIDNKLISTSLMEEYITTTDYDNNRGWNYRTFNGATSYLLDKTTKQGRVQALRCVSN